MSFNAIVLERNEASEFKASIKKLSKETLLQQQGDTLLEVKYSSINYKDALALTNKGPVVRSWPMVPGIDGVGTVVSCDSGCYKSGDQVVLNGWGCGETHWGCLAQYAYVQSDWLISLPEQFTPQQAMAMGTAGYTAALCVQRIIEHGVKPEQGSILVTGASGGVGSVAIALLSKLGYQVTAATSKIAETGYLRQLGAVDFIDSQTLKQAGRPLQKEQWPAAIDVLGSHALANVCAQVNYGGIVAACGLAQGLDFPTTVAPFILRGVTLAGVDSVMAAYGKRLAAWNLLAQYMDADLLNQIAKTISLNESIEIANQMIAGKIKGRFIVNINI